MLKKGLAVASIVALLATPALALDQPSSQAGVQSPGSAQFVGIGLALGLGIAALGGALGQSNAIGKSVDAVARQPEAGGRIQGMMIIGLALIETLVIYMLLICFMWGDKVWKL
jgi:F-type H+-transporting ATPase subunit c